MLASSWIVALLLAGLALVLHVREVRDRRVAERTWCVDSNCLCFGGGPALSIDAGRHRRPHRDAEEAHWMTLDMAEAERDRLVQALPWLAPMTPRGGQATAYVCRNFTCLEPATSPEVLREQLAR